MEVTSQKIGMTQAEIADARSRAEAIRKQQIASDQKLTQQITDTQKESEAKIGAVATDVTGAKKDIEATRTDLEATKSKLDRATGDMGVMSGLIARNHDDLEELKRRGDRNYYEFTSQKCQVAAARRPRADRAQQDRPEEIQIHHDRAGGRQVHREKRQDRRRTRSVLREGCRQRLAPTKSSSSTSTKIRSPATWPLPRT